MGRAEEMRNLCQDIANSFDARVARVAALKQETAEMLKGFQHDLRQKATDLKRSLGTSESARMSDFRVMRQGIRAGQEARSREVEGRLSGCRQDRQAAAGHWRGMATTMAGKRARAGKGEE